MKLIKILLAFLFLVPYLLKAQEPDVIEHSLELFKKEYPEGFENLYVPALRYAGDINGDGLADFRLSSSSLDLDTDDLYDYKFEYKIYYGSTEPITDYDTEISFDIGNKSSLPGYTPVGDLNGDGCDDHRIMSNQFFFDLSCGNFTDTLSVDFNINFSTRYSTTEIDVNDDGFEDIILYHSDQGGDRSFNFGIFYGAENPDSILYKEFELPFKLNEEDQEDRFYREASITAGDIDNDGDIELIVFGYNSFSESDFTEYNPGDILILEKSDSLGYEVVFSYNLPYKEMRESSRIYLGDYKQGGLKEILILESFETKVLVELAKTDAGFEVVEEVNLNEEGEGLSFIYPIGDYDQDGTYDFASFGLGTNKAGVLFGTSELGVYNETELNLNNRFISINNWNRDYFENTPNGYLGDINSDGFPDFLMSSTELLEGEDSPDIDNVLGEGVLFQYGNSERDGTQRHELFFPTLARQEALSTFNAGDFNNDGIEDYGVLFKTSITSEKKSRIELFFGQQGKTNWELAGLVLAIDDGFEPSYPAVGDFNGDGVSDIVVNYQNSESGVHFYWGGSEPNNESDQYISSLAIAGFESFEYDYTGFSILGNLKDINGDGIDDLGLTGLYYASDGDRMNSTYILFGGDKISATPDIELEGTVDNLMGLGDIDQDGKNEFLTSDIQNDNVIIYEGFNSSDGEIFSKTPDYVISENVLDFTIDVRGMGFNSEVGDFNGDGINDVVVVPWVSQDGSRVNSGRGIYEYNGGTMLFIFYGGDDFDTNPDQEIRIPISNLRSINGINLTKNETEFVSKFTGEINKIPSFDGDSIDEIFVGTSTSDFLTNALILSGDSLKNESMLKANNLNLGLGSELGGDFGWTYTNVKSAIGDFNADGKLDFILPQSGDLNFPEDPVFVYSLGVIETSVEENDAQPTRFTLSQNYPNPFNPSTQINYSLVNSGQVSLRIYDITGRLITTLVDGTQTSGIHAIQFDASNLSSGVYFYRLESESGVLTKKMTLIK